MITRKIENPVHTIVLDYEEGKPETDYEKELVNRYVAFLNKINEMNHRMKELRNQYYKEIFFTEECDPLLKQIEERYAPVKKRVNEIKKTNIIDVPDFFQMRDYHYATNDLFLKFHTEKVDQLRKIIDDNDEVFQKLHKWFDDGGEDEAYDEFGTYMQELYNNYDNYSLDLCQFDVDVDNMRGDWQKISEGWEKLFDFRESTVKSTTRFCERITAVNELAEALTKDIKEMNDQWESQNN